MPQVGCFGKGFALCGGAPQESRLLITVQEELVVELLDFLNDEHIGRSDAMRAAFLRKPPPRQFQVTMRTGREGITWRIGRPSASPTLA